MIDVPNTLLEKGYAGLTDAETADVLEFALTEIRDRRNKLLKLTDVYTLADYPFASDTDRQSMLTYRQTLRDITVGINPTYNTNSMQLQGVTFPTHSLVTKDMYDSSGAVFLTTDTP